MSLYDLYESCQTITSPHNTLIKKIAQLHKARERKHQQLFIAEGKRTCLTLIEGGYTCTTLLIDPAKISQEEALSDFTHTHLHAIHDIVLTNSSVMHKVSSSSTPSGILGVFQQPPSDSLAALKSGLGIVLAGLNDPGNMGTIIRTCAALGIKSVIIPRASKEQFDRYADSYGYTSVDPFCPKVIQSTAGALAQVTLFQPTWQELVDHCRIQGVALCALVVSGGSFPENLIKDAQTNNLLLVVGNEAHGIPDQWLSECALRMTIPMPGGTESLNAAVAASIALYLTTHHCS